jgi:hypothetical protein
VVVVEAQLCSISLSLSLSFLVDKTQNKVERSRRGDGHWGLIERAMSVHVALAVQFAALNMGSFLRSGGGKQAKKKTASGVLLVSRGVVLQPKRRDRTNHGEAVGCKDHLDLPLLLASTKHRRGRQTSYHKKQPWRNTNLVSTMPVHSSSLLNNKREKERDVGAA